RALRRRRAAGRAGQARASRGRLFRARLDGRPASRRGGRGRRQLRAFRRRERAQPPRVRGARARHRPLEARARGTAAMKRLLLILVVSGCSALPDAPALVQARASVGAAQADADVATLAPSELRAARSSLARAETLAREGDRAEMTHQAYLAGQHSRIARELAQARRHDAQIARTGEEEKYRAAEAEAALARARAAQEQQSVASRELAAELERLRAQLLFESGGATLTPGGRRSL